MMPTKKTTKKLEPIHGRPAIASLAERVAKTARKPAAEVLVGDVIRPRSLHGFARVRGLTRMEIGVAFILADEGGEFTEDHNPHDEIEVAIAIRHPAGFLTYRVPHPRAACAGTSVYVSIPEDDD